MWDLEPCLTSSVLSNAEPDDVTPHKYYMRKGGRRDIGQRLLSISMLLSSLNPGKFWKHFCMVTHWNEVGALISLVRCKQPLKRLLQCRKQHPDLERWFKWHCTLVSCRSFKKCHDLLCKAPQRIFSKVWLVILWSSLWVFASVFSAET